MCEVKTCIDHYQPCLDTGAKGIKLTHPLMNFFDKKERERETRSHTIKIVLLSFFYVYRTITIIIDYCHWLAGGIDSTQHTDNHGKTGSWCGTFLSIWQINRQRSSDVVSKQLAPWSQVALSFILGPKMVSSFRSTKKSRVINKNMKLSANMIWLLKKLLVLIADDIYVKILIKHYQWRLS